MMSSNQRRTRKRRNKSFPTFAFTLIELLLVMAVIGILAALLLPVLGRARYSAQTAICVSNHRQIGMGLLQYASDFEGYYPSRSPVASCDFPICWSDMNDPPAWDLHEAAETYLFAPGTLACPFYPYDAADEWPRVNITTYYVTTSTAVYAGHHPQTVVAYNTLDPSVDELVYKVDQSEPESIVSSDSVSDFTSAPWLSVPGYRFFHTRDEAYHRGEGEPFAPFGGATPSDIVTGFADGSVARLDRVRQLGTTDWGSVIWPDPD